MRNTAVLLLGLALLAGARADAQTRERSPEPMIRRRAELPFKMMYSEGGRGWLGFSFEVVQRMRLPREDSAQVRTPAEAVIVKEVRAGSPAEKAGVQHGDTIISLNGLTTNERLVNSLATFLEPGDTVRLRIRRAGRESELRLIAEPRPSEYAFRGLPDAMVFEGDSVRSMMRVFLDSARMRLDTIQFPRMHIERTDSTIRYWSEGGAGKRDTVTMLRRFPKALGIGDLPPMEGSFAYAFDLGRRAIAGAELQNLSAELGEYFGVTHGVLVLRVGKETPAGEAGLQAGDVITKANSTAINTIDELRSAISAHSKEPVKLQVLRKKKPVTIQLKGDR